MKDGKYSIGIIGLRGRGMYFTTEDIMRLQNSYVSCVCDIVPERVEEALQKLDPSVTGYTDVDAFLKHPDLDAVFVVTSDKSHAFLAKKVLAAIQIVTAGEGEEELTRMRTLSKDTVDVNDMVISGEQRVPVAGE